MGEQAVRALLLDADGVLQRVAGGWEQEFSRLFGDDAEAFIDVAFSSEDAALRGEEEFADRLATILAKHGWGERHAVSVDDVLSVWLAIDVYDESFDLVRVLRAGGLPVHLATNQHRLRALEMRHRLGYDDAFDRSFYSWEMGVKKPEPAYFKHIVAELGEPADRLLFVDDRDENVAAARAVGLRAEVWHPLDGYPALHALLGRHGVVAGPGSGSFSRRSAPG